jgi:hypothetical protein
MSRQFKRNGLRYVITDGEEIDFVRYDNKENILIALKDGAGFRGKLVRDNKRYDYAIERIESGDLEADIKAVSEERRIFHPPSYNHRQEEKEKAE